MSQADYQGWLKWAKQDGRDPQGLLAAVCAQQYDWEADPDGVKEREKPGWTNWNINIVE